MLESTKSFELKYGQTEAKAKARLNKSETKGKIKGLDLGLDWGNRRSFFREINHRLV